MRALVAVASCVRDCQNGYNDAIRETWGKDCAPAGLELRFFAGGGVGRTAQDEVGLDCPDGYLDLPWKTKAILQWALREGFDFIFKVDTDTFAVPDRLARSGFQHTDYTGSFNGQIGARVIYQRRCWSWASGGSGYWLSRRAAEVIVAEAIGPLAICPKLKYPCEDLWVGQVLGPHVAAGWLQARHDEGYGRSYSPDFSCILTSHFCSAGQGRVFDPAWQHHHYAALQREVAL